MDAGVPPDLNDLLRVAEACGLNHTVIAPDGTVHGFLASWPRPGPKTDPPADSMVAIYGGDQLLFKVSTMGEAWAYLYGVLTAFCGDVGEAMQRMEDLSDIDSYERSVALHKLGLCPIWNDRDEGG